MNRLTSSLSFLTAVLVAACALWSPGASASQPRSPFDAASPATTPAAHYLEGALIDIVAASSIVEWQFSADAIRAESRCGCHMREMRTPVVTQFVQPQPVSRHTLAVLASPWLARPPSSLI